jgi:hypothetical protein
MKLPANAETVEMTDGRVYYSTDNWHTIYVVKPGGKPRKLTGKQASHARLLAVYAK